MKAFGYKMGPMGGPGAWGPMGLFFSQIMTEDIENKSHNHIVLI